MKLYRKNVVAITTFLCLGVLFYGIPSAIGQSAHTAKLIEGSKKEGKLVWYSSLNISDARHLLLAFEKKYPFVKTELFRASSEKVMNRIMTETRAGRWEFDLTASSTINVLIRHKLIAPYISPEAKAYVKEFKDPEGYWTGVFNIYFVIGYNTTLISENEAPKKWEDLLNPKWKGKISIDQEDFKWYATLVSAWGKEKTQRYMKALAKQEIQWRKGHTLMTQLMAAGEFPLAIVFAHRVESMKKWAPRLNGSIALIRSSLQSSELA